MKLNRQKIIRLSNLELFNHLVRETGDSAIVRAEIEHRVSELDLEQPTDLITRKTNTATRQRQEEETKTAAMYWGPETYWVDGNFIQIILDADKQGWNGKGGKKYRFNNSALLKIEEMVEVISALFEENKWEYLYHNKPFVRKMLGHIREWRGINQISVPK